MSFINETEWEICTKLLGEGKLDVVDLKESTNRGQATIYRHTKELDKMGLIEVTKDFPPEANSTQSRRRKFVELTEKGRKVAEKILEINNILNHDVKSKKTQKREK